MGNLNNELKNWQQIPKLLINDNTISDRARFVYCFMACKPENWDFFMQPLAKDLGYSVDTLRKYITELIEAGWLSKKDTSISTKYILNAIKKNREEENIQYDINNIKLNKKEEKDTNLSKKADEDAFIERMYNLYPTKCPCRNTTLGKCSKDKDRIRKLLKTYSMEQIESVIKNEVETKYGKSWMQNFSTFLNNFPDPNCLFNSNEVSSQKENDILIINGVKYQ